MLRSSETRPLRIAVSGSGERDAHNDALAEEVGRLLARAGAIVICGGRSGVMEAVAHGAASAGGITVGFLPGERVADANPYIQIPIPTGLGEARNVLVARSGDALIAIGGEWGTLSEIALARKTGVPVVLLAPMLADALDLPRAQTAEQAVEMALALARKEVT